MHPIDVIVLGTVAIVLVASGWAFVYLCRKSDKESAEIIRKGDWESKTLLVTFPNLEEIDF